MPGRLAAIGACDRDPFSALNDRVLQFSLESWDALTKAEKGSAPGCLWQPNGPCRGVVSVGSMGSMKPTDFWKAVLEPTKF